MLSAFPISPRIMLELCSNFLVFAILMLFSIPLHELIRSLFRMMPRHETPRTPLTSLSMLWLSAKAKTLSGWCTDMKRKPVQQNSSHQGFSRLSGDHHKVPEIKSIQVVHHAAETTTINTCSKILQYRASKGFFPLQLRVSRYQNDHQVTLRPSLRTIPLYIQQPKPTSEMFSYNHNDDHYHSYSRGEVYYTIALGNVKKESHETRSTKCVMISSAIKSIDHRV